METTRYIHVVRAHWVLVLVTVLICTAGAVAYGWTRQAVYAAHTQLFVSTPVTSQNLTPSEVYQGGLASQARAESYARLVSNPALAKAVIKELHLKRSVQEVQSAISATVPTGTVLINVTVEDPSPRRAQQIANSLGRKLPNIVASLESTGSEAQSEKSSREASVQVSVSSPAGLPRSPEPPGKAVYVVAGVVLGLLLGVAAAVLRELFDRRIRDDAGIEAVAGAPVLGSIPLDRRASRRPLVVIEDSTSVEAEAYRRLRTNLRVLTMEHDLDSLLVASAVAREGKTLIAANLAFAFAQAGHRVVLVDADMRSRRLSGMLGLSDGPGLSEYLAGSSEQLHSERSLPLAVLSSGARPPNPSELLESPRLTTLFEALSGSSDIVIVDSPPLLPVSDASIISLATEAVLLVTRATSTQSDQLNVAAEQLQTVGIEPIGAVLNGVSVPLGGPYAYERMDTVDLPEPAVPSWD
jgi:succinoglycan biosynthesis transport protein ExoP